MRTDRWALRTVPDDLVRRYEAEGWWTADSLGMMVAHGLASQRDTPFNVYSAVHPYRGTFGEVEDKARALAASLQQRGVGPGDVMMFQLPNWVEAGIAFWAAAYLGAVVVPVVHFYGPKEVGYILATMQPDVIVTPLRFGHTDHVAMYQALFEDLEGPSPLWLVVGDVESDEPPALGTPFDSLCGSDPIDAPIEVDPDAPAIVAFTSGTTRDPKGVIHSHRTIGFETRQLDELFPFGGPAQITGAPVGHFIGMVNAFLVPLLRFRAVNMVDVWDPTEVLRLMRTEGLGVGGGATYFMLSLLDHPDFSDEHLSLMPYAGLGGSSVPVSVMERLSSLGIEAFRSYGSTEHPSITGCSLDDPRRTRETTDGRALTGVEVRLDDEGEILSRGPDCFVGYVDPELTSQVFDDQGWYRTGDVGVMDEDGYLAITDRLSDVIIRGGENIGGQEVEEALASMDAIAEVSVVARPDDKFGERVAAVMRLHSGVSMPTLDDVRSHLDGIGLARQKWPESLFEVEEFPRTASGKVQKFVLRNDLREGRLGSGS